MRTARVMGWAAEADATLGLAGMIAGIGLRWWNEINESDEWQRWLYYTLCGCYCFNSLVALVQIIRIQLRVPEYGWKTQKIFLLMNFIINGLRAVLFGFYQNAFILKPKVLEIALFDLPSLLFFSTYTLLALFWAEVYHKALSQPADKLRPAYLIINCIVYLIQISIWVYMQASSRSIAMDMAKLFLSVLSFFAALGFLMYGGRLFLMLWYFPLDSRGRRKKLNEVGYITGICSACFLIRCIMVAISECDKDADIDVLDHPILNFIYYMLVEILPSALVLFILRKLPRKRVSHCFHTIY
ncbi:tobamovirus multiplication protein 1-like [Phalaenopsis equestris]|uniref:tobamovirus multiplication protein 1-like n=1 Tax=Phalaenopsis equestris TaxID=78828 RepID=UPI0009E5E356|nr:tobamovirus multiplication protein 1-like [Phalaenopsis equestris]XP_020580924.1 tobamovirus multiplication protein 1-like [Phalaenopsis equestris]